jgi:hypothetical protein
MALHSTTPLPTPTLDPDLADLLPELVARGVNITTTSRALTPCEACPDTGRTPGESVAVIAHRAPSEALPDGFVYRPPFCSEHIRSAVVLELRRGSPTWIEVISDRGAVR